MLDNGSCTIKGGKGIKFHNEVNKINMLEGIKRILDGEIIRSKILITTISKREIIAMKLSSPSNHRITLKIQGLNDPPSNSTSLDGLVINQRSNKRIIFNMFLNVRW
jgi:hypothetical protein